MKTIAGFDRIGEENAFAVLARAGALAAQGMDVINLGIGQPDFRTPDHIVEAAIKALRDGHHGYTPATGIPPLREAVSADLHRRFDVEVNPDNVLIVPGGKITMFAAILMFGEPGAEILYPDPGFPIYRSMIEFTGANPVPVPIREDRGFAFSAEELLSLITPKTRLIILNSPANPCGGVTPKSEVDALVAGLANHPEVAVMSDEIYDQMLYDGEEHVSLLSYPEIRDRLILLNGWSKTYAMTGWRLGYSVWPDGIYDKARKLAVNAWSCVNAPAQYAALEALTGPQDAVAEMLREFDARRKLVVELLNGLPGVSCVVPKGAFYAFPNISGTGYRAKALASDLLEQTGVATIGGPDFGTLGEGYIRLSYANSRENIARAIERMRTFLSKG
ncbi:pyridoxal phosphate-dependent aminotransferase [Sedimentitalea sp. JM2-8]|uniref:aspartate transaminase n=1 Tax=Sedimentitalea xiamensis TaxID=3050037 RepID=A0ABT7FC28_9RHOB|nr:pyridoxal phosphate-dependent aminotransferase [Sedimentitalea xiamensis]MDK3072615.1 pyridoxal phosphate-dependent aminotransferase [Sedimentitalea xiamensis]